MQQFNISALRKKPKATLGAGISGQASGKGDRTIKRVNRSYMTAEKITTDKAYRSIMDQQQEHFTRTEGNRGYGSLIRAEGNLRGSDRVAGEGSVRRNPHGVGGGGVGKNWGGKFEQRIGDALRNEENRESLIKNAGGRRGLQQTKIASSHSRAEATRDTSVFIPTWKHQRGDNLGSGTVSENFLKVSVRPTETYTTLGQYQANTSFGLDIGNIVNHDRIVVDAKSGKSTQNRFEKYTPDEVRGIQAGITVDAYSGKKFLPQYEKEHSLKDLEPKIQVKGESGKQFLPQYEKEHFSRKLDPKLMAKNINAVKSTSRNNARVATEHFIRLTPNRPTIEIEAQTPKITRIIDPVKESYKLRHAKPNLKDFRAESNPSIPTF
jgi:hypothetical protein